jgi:hypothetical protein
MAPGDMYVSGDRRHFAMGCALPDAAAQSNARILAIRPKVIVVVYFEVGKDTGDTPGELQFWVERDHLDRVIDVSGMSRAVRANADGSEVAIAVGHSTGREPDSFRIQPAVRLEKELLADQWNCRRVAARNVSRIGPSDRLRGEWQPGA